MHESTPPPNQLLSRTGRLESAQLLQQLCRVDHPPEPHAQRGRRAAAFCTNKCMMRPQCKLITSRSTAPRRPQHRCSPQLHCLPSPFEQPLRHGDTIRLSTAPRRPRPRPPAGGSAAASATPHVTTPSCPPPRRGAVWWARRYARGLREALRAPRTRVLLSVK